MLQTLAIIMTLAATEPRETLEEISRWVFFTPEDVADVTTPEGFREALANYDAMIAEDELADEAYDDYGSHDLSDDAYALASAGWGTDEDYGCYGGDEW